MEFAKVNDKGELEIAGATVELMRHDVRVQVLFPTEAQRNEAGEYRVNGGFVPPCDEGYVASPTGRWKVEDNECRRVFDIVPAPPAVPATRQFSKLKLYAVLSRMNLWQPLVEWMQEQTYEGMSVYTAFVLAQDLTEDNEMFAPYLKMAQNALGVSDDVVEQILSQSILED